MKGQTNLVLDTWKHSLSLAVGVLTLSAAQPAAAAGDSTAAHDSYTWSAELIAFDETSRTVTVKSRVVGHGDTGRLADLRAGDRAMLTWSGLFAASGVRSIVRGTKSEFERFTMPIEFVSSEMDGQYVQFKVPIPGSAVSTLKSLAPGDWVTATSSHQPSDWKEAVSAIRPYNDVA